MWWKRLRAFDKFDKKEKIIRKTIKIDDKLYEKLQMLSDRVFVASVNQLINASIEKLVISENITNYKKGKDDVSIKHTLQIRESLIIGLERLKAKYNISICKLVNMSIHNAIYELENKLCRILLMTRKKLNL